MRVACSDRITFANCGVMQKPLADVFAELRSYVDCFRDDHARVLVRSTLLITKTQTIPTCIARCKARVSRVCVWLCGGGWVIQTLVCVYAFR